jgi:hypothetical protein
MLSSRIPNFEFREQKDATKTPKHKISLNRVIRGIFFCVLLCFSNLVAKRLTQCILMYHLKKSGLDMACFTEKPSLIRPAQPFNKPNNPIT